MIDTEMYGISEQELYLFNQGSSHHSYRFMGAHPIKWNGKKGTRFAVWAPNAKQVAVVGDFNQWNGREHRFRRIGKTGIHIMFVEGIREGEIYKYEITTSAGQTVLKSDPFAFSSEFRPHTASIVTGLKPYAWKDQHWYKSKKEKLSYNQPMLIYEVHAGSWKIKGKELFYSYDELATELIPHVVELGFTHIELMPLAEHPLDQSWGYQITGFYSPTSRYGRPDQLKNFINICHLNGIGVILDWVPGHFCRDLHGLANFDGTPLFEGADWKRADLPLWGTLSFDYSISEVHSFLISNAIYWIEQFHFDGLRVDAVATMLDLHMDKPVELRTLNEFGGNLNLHAITFLKKLNETLFHYYPEILMHAEDSSSFAAVTSPSYAGGLGFNYKWNMGWMNDMLRYMSLHPSDRTTHHHLVTFSLWYAYSENFLLPLSHDEVVHGKRSLLNKMWGSYEEKFAQLRMFYGYWMTHPGKKLLFMGGEWAQFDEWKDQDMLDWMVLQYDSHRHMLQYVKTLNNMYRQLPALWEQDFTPSGFKWIDSNNHSQSVISFIRYGHKQQLVVIINFSNHHYTQFRVGVPSEGEYELLLHSNDSKYGGYVSSFETKIAAENISLHFHEYSIQVDLPPFTFLLLKNTGRGIPTVLGENAHGS